MIFLRSCGAVWLMALALLPIGAQADSAFAVRRQLFAEVNQQLDQARAAQVEVLAPDSYGRAMKHYRDADAAFARSRNLDGIRKDLAQARQWLTKAMEATNISAIALAQAMQHRRNALSADAPRYAGTAWQAAEKALKDAAAKMEGGDIRRANEISRQVAELYQQAELSAIKTNYLSGARSLLEQARKEGAEKHANKTFVDARLLLEQAERELTENRYDTDYPRDLARRARNEAQHAITITRRTLGVRKKDFNVEDIITDYEKPLIAIADQLDIVPALHEGYESTRDAILLKVDTLQKDSQELQQLRLLVDNHEQDIARLTALVADYEQKLGIYNEQLSEYNARLAAEARYRALLAELENLFSAQEADVFRQGRTMIIRMVGLNFDSGKAELKTEHKRLLAKVVYAVQLSKTELTTIEGHTDSHGSDELNMALSEERAQAVVNYLKGEAQLADTELVAVGYGESRPIANNESAAGREKNRRIDVVIQLEREPMARVVEPVAPALPADDVSDAL